MKKELIAYKDPKSPVSEMFRTLRTNLQFMNTDDELKTILITSTLPGEGKSWVASNLAVTFAQTGKKTILVDADMRKGRLYKIFEVLPRPGLSNYLSGVLNNEKSLKSSIVADFVQKTEIDNLSVIPAGNVPPNPSELLVSHKTTRLIEQLSDTYDIIIFDGTPSLLVTDAIILSRLVDMTLLVTAHKETKVDNIDKVKRTIENVGGNVVGVVVNKLPISSKKYQDTYYYGSRSGTTKTKTSTIKLNKSNKLKKEVKPEPIAKKELNPEVALESIAKEDLEPKVNDKIIIEEQQPELKLEPIVEKDLKSKIEQKPTEKEELQENLEIQKVENTSPIPLQENTKAIVTTSNETSKIDKEQKHEENRHKEPPKPKTARRKSQLTNTTTVRRTIKTMEQSDIKDINNIIEESMSKPKKRKSKASDRSKDILNQINRYLDKQ